MLRSISLISLIVGWAGSVAAQDQPPLPIGPAPEFRTATAVEKGGEVFVQFTTFERYPITEFIEVERDGQKVKMAQTKMEEGWGTAEVKVDGKSLIALGTNGKMIDPKELLKRLDKSAPVAVFSYFDPKEEAKPDPYYLQFLRTELVVFTQRVSVPDDPPVPDPESDKSDLRR